MTSLLKTVLAGLALGALAGCVQPPKELYVWGAFPRQQYETLLSESSTTDTQIQALETFADQARGANAALPPGFRAHLGMLHLAVGNAGAASQMFQAEKAAFPESAPYIDSLLKRLNGAASLNKAAAKQPI